MTVPTSQDATLLLCLVQWQATCGVPTALRWLNSAPGLVNEAIRTPAYPPDSVEQKRAVLICDVFELVGILHQYHLINDEILFAWQPVARIWDRVQGFVIAQREEASDATLWMHFEALAVAHKRAIGVYAT